MKIKKFLAASTGKAFEQIKKEFGEDAIILNTRQIKDENNPDKPPKVEVTAAIDKKESPDGLPKASFKEKIKKSGKGSSGPRSLNNFQFNLLQKEIDYISERMESLINHIKFEKLPHVPKVLQQKIKTLISNGVAASLANDIAEDILLNLKGEDFLQTDLVDEKIILKLKSKFAVSGPVRFNKNVPTVVVLIGPTGAGKTTTVAKLAAFYKFKHAKKTAIISVDSYRIAAMEQLKAFSKLAKIKFAGAFDVAELNQKIAGFQNHDLIIIDTPGINPKNMKKMVSLKESIRAAKADEIHLVTSACTKLTDLRGIIKNFTILNFDNLIYTKLDETTSFGDVLNIAVEFEKPVSYVSDGQNIPENLHLADRKDLAMTILRGKYGIL